MNGREQVSSSVLDFIKALAANVAEILKIRMQLFASEAAEEGQRVIKMLIWAVAALFCAGMAFILLNVTVVYLFWDSARLTVLICLTLFYIFLLAGAAISFRLYWRRQRLPFANTIDEFKKDFEWMRRRD